MKDEVLANFYANLALVWLAAGFVGPIFSPIENRFFFVIRLISSLIFARMSLQIGLNKLK
ncbi:MAG: hypothetical protein UR68_C0040G0013 [Candidatus Roizmanbacteria bacterium GW2011_GWA2_35_19]|uniref:Uncharacterized protein n=2 Tax=Candidatus Roizmaniibacteriota TaxID=1752723 RepID=A0A0G0C3H7_9BACT|nr:MAG: hypothetical protein UR63_C0021G0005 [Candidatus Roizmanbacteria bacterium GW2011_GWC2_35_12]KKP70626.1 MAG: hypothetical protein UR68_C0040G0013 [Candidatus Roizmanbacteria bacterium GW2011_GWA2_35_19]